MCIAVFEKWCLTLNVAKSVCCLLPSDHCLATNCNTVKHSKSIWNGPFHLMPHLLNLFRVSSNWITKSPTLSRYTGRFIFRFCCWCFLHFCCCRMFHKTSVGRIDCYYLRLYSYFPIMTCSTVCLYLERFVVVAYVIFSDLRDSWFVWRM